MDDDVRALGRDLVCIPLATGLDNCLRCGEVDDRSCAIVGVLVRIVNIDLIATFGLHLFWILAANIDAAIRVEAGPEFQLQLKIAIRLLRDEIAPLVAVRLDVVVDDVPLRVAEHVEVAEIRAIEERPRAPRPSGAG